MNVIRQFDLKMCASSLAFECCINKLLVSKWNRALKEIFERTPSRLEELLQKGRYNKRSSLFPNLINEVADNGP